MKSKILFTIILFLFSLLYLRNTVSFIQKNDPLMQEINDKAHNYYRSPINAIITNKMMIPGIQGHEINVKKSFQKMKAIHSFNESLIVYNQILPNKTIKNHFDKIIVHGNKQKNEISIVLDINNSSLFHKLQNVLVNNNIKVDILSNQNFIIQNTNFQNIISNNYYSFTDYCLTYNLNINENCINNNKYTLLGHFINNNHLSNTKHIIENGVIIVYQFNDNNYQDLSLIIKYLKNNNYKIVSINELINE